MSQRKILRELVLEPITGKALEVRRGEVLRIEQVEGRHCVDFNAFNLHDYKEFFHSGRTRQLHGRSSAQGRVPLDGAAARAADVLDPRGDRRHQRAASIRGAPPSCSRSVRLGGAHELPRHARGGDSRVRPHARRRA